MHIKTGAAVGALALAAAIAIPVGPAYADSARVAEWHLKYLKVAEAQAITKGAGITVAVVDSGVYPNPDLKRNLLKGTDIVKGGDGTGHVDQLSHGTGVASLIAAHGNGSNGILGIAPESKILPIKVGNNNVFGDSADSSDVGNGIQTAVDRKVNVINVSISGAPSFETISSIKAAAAADIVVVAGAGNTDQDPDIGYPAALDGVLAVGSIGKNGKHSDFSVTGQKVGICAPGADIAVDDNKPGFVRVNGTSASTAIVSGAVALVRAKFPNLSAPEVIHRLEATADDIGSAGKDDQCGYGVLNIVKALTADVPPLSGNSAGPSSSASVTTASDAPTFAGPSTDTAQSEAADTSSGSGLVIFGLAAVVVIAGLVAVLVLRRRPR